MPTTHTRPRLGEQLSDNSPTDIRTTDSPQAPTTCSRKCPSSSPIEGKNNPPELPANNQPNSNPNSNAEGDGLSELFAQLLTLVAGRTIDSPTGELIQACAAAYLKDHPLDAFDHYSELGYQRTCIGRCPSTGWEALVMSWKQGNTTTIHSHPQFAGYNFADGRFQIEIFEPAAHGAVRLAQTLEVQAPQSFHAIGTPGCFDNHIHRITCLSHTGHSLHIYSDDALKGFVYQRIVP